MMKQARTILLSGAPGTGKSTVRQLAPSYFRDRYGATAAFDTDEFYTFFDPAWSMTDRSWWYVAYDACLATAQYLLQRDITTVLISSNGIYAPADVNRALDALYAQSSIYHVTLDTAHDVIVERVRRRGDLSHHPPEWLADWQAHIRHHYAPWTLVLDTSHRTPREVLDAIYDHTLKAHAALPEHVSY